MSIEIPISAFQLLHHGWMLTLSETSPPRSFYAEFKRQTKRLGGIGETPGEAIDAAAGEVIGKYSE